MVAFALRFEACLDQWARKEQKGGWGEWGLGIVHVHIVTELDTTHGSRTCESNVTPFQISEEFLVM